MNMPLNVPMFLMDRRLGEAGLPNEIDGCIHLYTKAGWVYSRSRRINVFGSMADE